MKIIPLLTGCSWANIRKVVDNKRNGKVYRRGHKEIYIDSSSYLFFILFKKKEKKKEEEE